jgi:hypothetical protein
MLSAVAEPVSAVEAVPLSGVATVAGGVSTVVW